MEILGTKRNNSIRYLNFKIGYSNSILKNIGRFSPHLCLLLILCLTCGCDNKFFDPTQIGRFRPVPSVNVILDSLGVAEETPVAWEEAEEPKPIDTVVTRQDYDLRPGDVVRIVLTELTGLLIF